MGSIIDTPAGRIAGRANGRIAACAAGAVAVMVTVTSPASAAPRTPFDFLLQLFDPGSYAAPAAQWSAFSLTRAPRGPSAMPVSLQQPGPANEEYLHRRVVAAPFNEEPGTVIVDTAGRFLYLMLDDGRAMRYGVGVGRQGFEWQGVTRIGRKVEWPDWVPPAQMREREPWLPERVPGGVENPLGARALYLFKGDADTLYRIHGTNQPETIGQALSSGCIRMLNDDVADLYERVPVGTKVVVL